MLEATIIADPLSLVIPDPRGAVTARCETAHCRCNREGKMTLIL